MKASELRIGNWAIDYDDGRLVCIGADDLLDIASRAISKIDSGFRPVGS